MSVSFPAQQVPESWTAPEPLQKRIICHWCVTSYTPDEVSLDSYHFVIDGKGNVHRGYGWLNERFPHTYMFNSAIGISLACMGGYNSMSDPGDFPPTEAQWESLVTLVRQIVQKHGIPVDPFHVLMHGEVTANLKVDQAGKWDIGWLPHLKLSGATNCGDELRRRVLAENDDNKTVPVAVRVAGSKMVVKGTLMDAATFVPIREFCKEAGLKLGTVWPFNAMIEGRPHDLVNIRGTGFTPLRELCLGQGWEPPKVEAWTRDKRIVVVTKKPRVLPGAQPLPPV